MPVSCNAVSTSVQQLLFLQISMNVQQQLTTVMEWLTVTTIKAHSHVSAGKATLVMGYFATP